MRKSVKSSWQKVKISFCKLQRDENQIQTPEGGGGWMFVVGKEREMLVLRCVCVWGGGCFEKGISELFRRGEMNILLKIPYIRECVLQQKNESVWDGVHFEANAGKTRLRNFANTIVSYLKKK
jgi:hypothetical protein